VVAFATYSDLSSRLNRVFTGQEEAWVNVLLEDASTYLRDDVIGQQVYPQTTSTFSTWATGGRIDLPQSPVVSVGAVTQDGVDVDFDRRDSAIYVVEDVETTVTFTFGFESAPESLMRWACVLVSQTLIPLELNLGLTVGGLSSVALDDFKASFADAGESTGMTLSPRNVELIRDRFSRGTTVVGMR
jgi:hypothetical protein